jgi:hypothetical protein
MVILEEDSSDSSAKVLDTAGQFPASQEPCVLERWTIVHDGKDLPSLSCSSTTDEVSCIIALFSVEIFNLVLHV